MFHFNKKESLTKYLHSLGVDKISHVKNMSLYDHFVRVGETLESWGLPEEIVLAGMCHSLYSSEFFKTVVLSINKRKELKDLIGTSSESLVFTFCSIQRDSLVKDADGYTFSSYFSQEKIYLTTKDTSALLHILLANDIDHLNSFNVTTMSSHFGRYVKWNELFCEKASEYLTYNACYQSTVVDEHKDLVRFIAHSGVYIQTKHLSLAIDPWLYSSTREKPKLQGFDPTSHTIDYIIPEPKNVIKDISSDVILLSHFHTHHSPFEEIKELAMMRKITLICPTLDERKIAQLKITLGDVFNKITFSFLEKDTTIHIGDVTIRVLTHSHKNHFAYYITTKHTSVLHIADASADKEMKSLCFDDFWEKFDGLEPEYLFVGAAGHSLKILKKHGEKDILENTTLTPVQAAKLARRIGAKHAGIIGVYNFSVWDSRIEYARSYEAAESEFYWAMSFLAPGVRVHQFRPGDVFSSGESSPTHHVQTPIQTPINE